MFFTDDDVAFLPAVGIVSKPQPSSLAHVLLTKSIYKPGEKVFTKAWFRRLEYNDDGLPKLILPGSGCKIAWSVRVFFFCCLLRLLSTEVKGEGRRAEAWSRLRIFSYLG